MTAERQIVVDASVLVEYLAPGPAHGQVVPLFTPDPPVVLWSPDLVVAEVANALRKRYLREAAFTTDHLREAVGDLLALNPVLVGAGALVSGTLELADRLTVYDALYLVLAARRGLALCTLDDGLAAAAERRGVDVLEPRGGRVVAWLQRNLR